jgi:two-component system NtrC family sensor kinase
VVATLILCRNPSLRAHRLAAAIVAAGSYWALCETLSAFQNEPGAALFWIKASSLGWVWFGPLTLHLLLELTGEGLPRLRAALPHLYAAAVGLLLIDWGTPWIHPGVVRTGWGWGYQLGPALVLVYLFSTPCFGVGLYAVWRACGRATAPGEREQARLIGLGILLPLTVASLTDTILPLLGIQVVRLGAVSFAVLGGMILWCFHRYDYSLLAPGAFAGNILETLPDGVAMLRLDGRIRSANGAMARLLGIRNHQLSGLNLAERLSDAPRPGEKITDQRSELTTSSGRRLPVSISTTSLRDRHGAEIGLVLVVRDLEEVVSLRDRLILSGRLAAVGELAAGIAHEINNPLCFVQANLRLLRQHWDALGSALDKADVDAASAGLLSEVEELVDESIEGVARAVAIVRDVRGLAHAGSRTREPADMNALLDGVLRMASAQLHGRANLEKVYGGVDPVRCAPPELQQVFLNLVLNAGHAIGPSGTIRVLTETKEGSVLVRIEDDGCGIEPAIADRIFDPFFTTKSVGEGTGLGLGIAYGIVRNHGGEMSFESEPGRGSCFCVRLPVDTDTLEPPI